MARCHMTRFDRHSRSNLIRLYTVPEHALDMAYGWSYSDNVIVAHAVLGGLLGEYRG